MDHQNTLFRRLLWLAAAMAILAALAFYYMVGRNGDMLYMAQNRSLWLSGADFFCATVSKPAGLLAYLSLYATQLLYEPWLGVGVMVALWAATLALLCAAFRVPSRLALLATVPFMGLLALNVSIGYWLYYLKFAGVLLSPSVALLLVAVAVWLSMRRRLWPVGYAAGLLLYPLVGAYSWVALLLMGCGALAQGGRWKWGKAVVAAAAALAMPWLWSHCYDTMRPDEIYAIGWPRFEAYDVSNSAMLRPLWLAMGSLFVLPWLRKVDINGRRQTLVAAAVQLLVVAAGIGGVAKAEYDNDVFRTECRVYRDVQEWQWSDALNHLGELGETPSRQLMLMKNIALWNLGELGSRLYDFGDVSLQPQTGDELPVRMAVTAAPLLYMNHGIVNHAIRWAIEETVEKGMNVDYLKVLTLCALVNGEQEVARKYLALLRRTTYHAAWADHYEPLARNAALRSKYPELTRIAAVRQELPERMADDEGLCEQYIVETLSTMPLSQKAEVADLSLAYALMSKDIQRFWPHFMQWTATHGADEVPAAYQQAAFLYATLEPQTAPTADEYNPTFDVNSLATQYQGMMQQGQSLTPSGLTEEAVGEALRETYGNTFWWTYYFVREKKYY